MEFVGYLGFWHFGLACLRKRRWGDEKRERSRDVRETMERYERRVVNDECNQLIASINGGVKHVNVWS